MPSNVSLQGIEFTIKGSADEASKSVKKLTDELNELKNALKKSEGIGGLATSLKKFENINTTMLSVAGTILKEISQLDFTNIRDAAQGIKDIAAAARQVAGIGSKDAPLEQVIGEPDKLRTALSYVQQFGHALGSTVLVSLKGVGVAAKGIGHILAIPFKAGFNHVKKFAEGLSNVVSSLKRIAFYRIVRSVIKAITQAFQEGLKNAYEFDKALGGEHKVGLAQALDDIATKSFTMKNQLGAAFGGLLTAIAPVVQQVIAWVTKLAEALSRLMALLGGKTEYLRAKEAWQDWGDAAQTAGGQAKKALEYLAPFDELNVLPDSKSGGGGGSSTNYDDMFEYADVGEGSGFLESIKGMLDKVSEFFETTDWAGLADSAWQKLKERFSDTGQATAVIRSLFEALGAALGAAASFIAQFVIDVCRDIWSYFKQYIKDDNGDGEITGREIIEGIWEGIKNAVKNIGSWIKTNIFDPFITGFKAAFGIHSPAEEMIPYGELITEGILAGIKNAWKNIKSWLLTNLYNPMAEAWNSLVGEDSRFALPIYGEIQEIGMGSSVHVTGGETFGGHSGSLDVEDGNLVLPMQGAVNTIQDKIAAAKKVISGITAGLTTAKDTIPSTQKKVSVAANYISGVIDQDKMAFGSAGRIINVRANYISGVLDKSSMAFGSPGRVIGVRANYISSSIDQQQMAFGSKGRTINVKANYTGSSIDQNTMAFGSKGRIINVRANYISGIVDQQQFAFGSKGRVIGVRANYISGVLDPEQMAWGKPGRIINTRANYTASKNELNEAQRTISSWADFQDYKNNLGTPSISSYASILDYVVASYLKNDGKMEVDSKIYISGQTNTPVLKADLEVGNVKTGKVANGGAFYGNAWHNIPQYASGGKPHGSLFIAGEAGAELVGHVGGRTEVLNRSQLASTMYSAVKSAMASTGFRISASPSPAYSTEDGGNNEDVLYRAFSRALSEADLGVDVELDGDKLYQKMVQRNKQEKRRLGLNPMMAV